MRLKLDAPITFFDGYVKPDAGDRTVVGIDPIDETQKLPWEKIGREAGGGIRAPSARSGAQTRQPFSNSAQTMAQPAKTVWNAIFSHIHRAYFPLLWYAENSEED